MLALMIAVTLAQCTKDTECKGERVCSEGVCIESDAPIAAVEPIQEPVKTALTIDRAKQLTAEIKELKAGLEDATYGSPIAKLVFAAAFAGLAVVASQGGAGGIWVAASGIASAALFLWGGIQFAIRWNMNHTVPDEIAAKEKELRKLTGAGG